ncbi:cadherin-like beta sandwich domain-containing protein [Gorillibacterium sp. sgz5001074]|uniref:cadherin-like beta sandwich domain-containing protein n=1 Tax=Gorillibacterium sp. sgz5001074 TaxID=3446695 RepID=UPI003F66B888
MNMNRPQTSRGFLYPVMVVMGMVCLLFLSFMLTDGKKAMASGNADLSTIYMENMYSPAFNSSTTEYSATFGSSTNNYFTAFMTADPEATMEYSFNGGSWVSLGYWASTGNLNLNYNTNTFDVKVTASDHVTTKTYHFHLFRPYPHDATIREILVSSGTLHPVSATDYAMEVPYKTDSISLTPALNDSSATMTINDVSAPNGASFGPIALSVGSNTIPISVTSADASQHTLYRIVIMREAPSENNNLSMLTLSDASLSPGFEEDTTTYTANVANGVHSITVTASVYDSTATITVSGEAISSGSSTTVNLSVGQNSIPVTVTAQNGSTKTYMLTVTRAASGIAELSGFTLDQGIMSPAFNPSILDYSVNIPNEVSSLVLSLTKAEPHERLHVTGAAYSSVTDQVYTYRASNLLVGTNLIQIAVRAQDGTQKGYTLTVDRMGSNNADLQSLILSRGQLDPAFEASITEYRAHVGNDVSSITVTASVYDSTARMKVNGMTVLSGEESAPIDLITGGTNTITIEVAAEDRTTVKQYKLTLTHEAAGVTPDSGGGNESDSPSAPPSGIVISTNGTLSLAAGRAGEVSLDKEIKLHIPANAFAQDLHVTVQRVGNTQRLLTHHEVLASPVFEILKSFPENFSSPVTLTIAFEPKSVQPSVFYYDEEKRIWTKAGGTVVDGNHIAVGINHFTKFAVLDEGQKPDPADEKAAMHFSDISGHWAEAQITQAAGEGIISGYPDGTFRPDAVVTRAEFTVMLMNALGAQGQGAKLVFHDTEKIGAWALQAVAQAVQANLLSGYEDGSFRPDAEISRAEMAVMAARALGLPADASTATGFADDGDIPAWAKNAVASLKKLGLMTGRGGDEFAPNGETTRAEAVTVLLKIAAQKK